jgi:hypothetical protein
MPRLRRQWGTPGISRSLAAMSPPERHIIWADVIRLTSDGAAEMRRLAPSDPEATADVAWATADALRASARAIGGAPGRQIRRSADDFDRAAHAAYRTIPRPIRPKTGSALHRDCWAGPGPGAPGGGRQDGHRTAQRPAPGPCRLAPPLPARPPREGQPKAQDQPRSAPRNKTSRSRAARRESSRCPRKPGLRLPLDRVQRPERRSCYPAAPS